MGALARIRFALALAPFPLSALVAQTPAAWRYQVPGEVRYFTVAATGALLVVTDSGSMALDGADGHVLWERSGARWLHGLGLTDLGVMAGRNGLEVTDLATGTARWSLRDLQLTKPYGSQSIPSHNLILVFGESVESPLSVVAASLDSGVIRWKQDTLFAAVRDLPKQASKIGLTAEQPLLLDTDSTLVLYPTRGGVMRLNLRTGGLLWRADTLRRKDPLIAYAGYARVAADSTTVYVAHDKRLMALDAATGQVRWDRVKEFPSVPAEVVPTPRGILVRGYYKKTRPSESVRGSLELLDPATGESRWPRPFQDIDNAAAMLVAGDTVYLAAKKSVMALDLGSTLLREVRKLDWKGGEVPCCLERRDSALVIVSSQNLACMNAGGDMRYERYYSAPGASFLSKLLSTTLIVAMNVASAAMAQSTANSTHAPVMYPVIVDNPVLSARYKATVNAERYVHMLTSAADETGRKGFSVVRLDKDSGQEAGRVWVDDRSPDYALDAASGTVYLLRDKHSLEALRFEQR